MLDRILFFTIGTACLIFRLLIFGDVEAYFTPNKPRSGRFWANIPESCTFLIYAVVFPGFPAIFCFLVHFRGNNVNIWRGVSVICVCCALSAILFVFRYYSFSDDILPKKGDQMQHELSLSRGPS